MDQLNLWIALWAGLISFFSPCCLPLYPSYLSYITGISVTRLREERKSAEVRFRTMSHTLFFILGFSVIFFALGAGAGLFADLFYQYRDWVRIAAGVLFIFMGLFLAGLFQPQFLMKEKKLEIKSKPAGYFGSFLLGVGFSAGWSPCIGPILGSIMTLASTEPGIWFGMTTAYTAGFAIPFFIFAFFIGSTRWILKYSGALMKVGGTLMVVIGVLLLTDQLYRLTVWLNSITPDWMLV
jgi:cytochrome c-type biogenesis protein